MVPRNGRREILVLRPENVDFVGKQRDQAGPGPGVMADDADPKGRVVALIEKVHHPVTPQIASKIVIFYETGVSIRGIAKVFWCA